GQRDAVRRRGGGQAAGRVVAVGRRRNRRAAVGRRADRDRLRGHATRAVVGVGRGARGGGAGDGDRVGLGQDLAEVVVGVGADRQRVAGARLGGRAGGADQAGQRGVDAATGTGRRVVAGQRRVGVGAGAVRRRLAALHDVAGQVVVGRVNNVRGRPAAHPGGDRRRFT